jgi:hypothetical protein
MNGKSAPRDRNTDILSVQRQALKRAQQRSAEEQQARCLFGPTGWKSMFLT